MVFNREDVESDKVDECEGNTESDDEEMDDDRSDSNAGPDVEMM